MVGVLLKHQRDEVGRTCSNGSTFLFVCVQSVKVIRGIEAVLEVESAEAPIVLADVNHT